MSLSLSLSDDSEPAPSQKRHKALSANALSSARTSNTAATSLALFPSVPWLPLHSLSAVEQRGAWSGVWLGYRLSVSELWNGTSPSARLAALQLRTSAVSIEIAINGRPPPPATAVAVSFAPPGWLTLSFDPPVALGDDVCGVALLGREGTFAYTKTSASDACDPRCRMDCSAKTAFALVMKVKLVEARQGLSKAKK